MDVIFGFHAVAEALKARPRGLEYVCVQKERHDGRMQRLINACRAGGVAVRFESREQLTRLAKTSNHQGVVAVRSETQYCDLGQILAHPRGEKTFVLVLDGVEDPHNLGALLRTADAAGVDGVVIPERRAVGVNATVVKASAGAAAHVPVAKVTNIGRTVDELKEQNLWTVGVDERGSKRYDEIEYTLGLALVLGGEGGGLHEKVRQKCDHVVRIPMRGRVSSLNVSVAGAIVMYEAARQRGFPGR
jgi:23S rRNA (guanosine2251-2'-O)-methyltransferase